MRHQPGLRRSALILLALGTAGCNGATEPPSAAVRLTAETATSTAGTVHAEVVPAPAVRATDADGLGVAGVPVTFEVGGGDGEIATTAIETEANGLATVGRWTLGAGAGEQTVTARADGLPDVVFSATAAAGPVARVVTVTGNNQIAPEGRPLEAALRVRVTDAYGNPIAGAPVTFSITTGGGSIAAGPVVTDAGGEAASGVWTLGPGAGEQRVRAACGPAAATFSAFAIPVGSTLPGRIAFVSLLDGNANIYAVNPDGSEFLQLTTDRLSEDLQPVWTPDGHQISFVARRDGQSGIYLMDADGGNVSGPISGESFSLDPAWPPDLQRIMFAYTAFREGSSDVVSLNTRTGAVSVLTSGPGYDGQPAWSPDGLQLAFVSDRVAYDFLYDIYTMNADGTNPVRLTNGFPTGQTGTRYYLHPAWSPDGRLIALVWGEYLDTTGSAMRFHVGVMAPDGTGTRDLAWAGDIRNAALDPGSLAWSPDGRGIAFSFTECDGFSELGCSRSVKYVPVGGGAAITLIPGGQSPSWR